jgi:dienelactone hydrolase
MKKINFSDLLLIREGSDMGDGDSRLVPIRSVQEWEHKAHALRQIFMLILGEVPYHDIDPAPEIVSEEDCGNYLRRKILYNSGPDERIPAYMLLPKTRQAKTPAVLCIHQTVDTGKDQVIGLDHTPQGCDMACAEHLVEQGFITFAYDILPAGERAYPGVESFDTGPFYEKYPNWSAVGKEAFDASQALNVLATMPEVDSDNLGSIGHSKGGGITIHTMALDKRIKAGVSSCGAWPNRISKNPFRSARASWWVGLPRMRPFCLTGKEFPVQLHELLALSAPRAIMNITALNDNNYTLDEQPFTRQAYLDMEENIKKIYRLYNREDYFESLIHLNGHRFIEEQRIRAYNFLKRHLTINQEMKNG